MMNKIDELIEKISNYQNPTDIDEFKSEILKRKLYLFVIDDGSFLPVTEIIWTGKDRPVSIPTIKHEGKISSVLYSSKETANDSKEDRFRISYMNGLKALQMMRNIRGLNEVIIQGKNAHVRIGLSEIDILLNEKYITNRSDL
jgi:hypothetical protein